MHTEEYDITQLVENNTATYGLSTQLEHVQFVRTQLVAAYFRVWVSQIAISYVSLQLIGAYFRVQGFPNCLCFSTMSKKPNGKRLNLESKVIFQGFDSLYKQVLNIEEQLLCPKFKQKQRKLLMTLRNRLNHFRARSKWSASKPNTKNYKTYTK